MWTFSTIFQRSEIVNLGSLRFPKGFGLFSWLGLQNSLIILIYQTCEL
jgi:hypothetical protein